MITSFRRSALAPRLASARPPSLARPVVVTQLRSLLSPAWTSPEPSCNSSLFAMLIPPIIGSSLLVRRVKIIRVKRRALCKSLFTAYSKASLERSFFYLNVDALFARIGLETTEWWLFEHHLHLFFQGNAFDRRRWPFSSCGCYSNSITFKPNVAAIDKRRKSILFVKDWAF